MRRGSRPQSSGTTREAGVHILGAIIGSLAILAAYAYAYTRWGWADA